MSEDTPTGNGERWYSPEEVGQLLGMSAVWAREKIRNKEIDAKQITPKGRGQYRVSAAAISRYMASRPDA